MNFVEFACRYGGNYISTFNKWTVGTALSPDLKVPRKNNQLVELSLLEKRLSDKKLPRDGAFLDTMRTPLARICEYTGSCDKTGRYLLTILRTLS